MKTWLYRIAVASILAILFYWLYPTSEANPRPTWWQIEYNSEQSANQVSILGAQLYQTNLQQFASIIKATPSIAMFTTRQAGDKEPPMHLEAYFDDVYDEGDRIILTLDADMKLLAHIKKVAFQPELFPNDVIRVAIPQELNQTVRNLTIKSITLVAGWQVEFEAFKAHFGEPSELLDDGQGNAHFLYPHLGLDFIQPAGGLQILQLVAPEQFEKDLRSPLIKAQPPLSKP